EPERQVAGRRGAGGRSAARAGAREVDGACAPAVMPPGGHRRVHQVIDTGDAVEHRAHLSGLQRPGAGSLASGHSRAYFSCDRNSTAALNLFAGRFLNEGIGAVGLTRVRAIMVPDVRRDAMWV